MNHIHTFSDQWFLNFGHKFRKIIANLIALHLATKKLYTFFQFLIFYFSQNNLSLVIILAVVYPRTTPNHMPEVENIHKENFPACLRFTTTISSANRIQSLTPNEIWKCNTF